LQRFIWNKKALGAPVGNLIILIAAVALSTAVVLYAVNVTSNQVQKESLYIAGATLDTEKATVNIVNTGPTSIRVSQITIKGERFTNYTTYPDIGDGLAKGNSTTITVILTPDLIGINDIGRPIAIVVSTTSSAYFTETLVQAATTEATPTPEP
jgi:methylaspartate ammonia-lyase